MASFSQRYGYSPTQTAFQRESISPTLRTSLWNVLNAFVWDQWEAPQYGYVAPVTERINELLRRIWVRFFKWDIDTLPRLFADNEKGAYDRLKTFFFGSDWYKTYDFIEFIAKDPSRFVDEDVRTALNKVLEEENAAYRLVGNEITEITDKNEIAEIEDSLKHPEAAVRTHLETALRMLSDRQAPDYRNSIKESISAVEAACRLGTGKTKATLGDALKHVPNLHPALKTGFSAIYGYTSDQSGIRHSLLDEPKIDYADAKFMLVACSAFIGFLKTKAAASKS